MSSLFTYLALQGQAIPTPTPQPRRPAQGGEDRITQALSDQERGQAWKPGLSCCKARFTSQFWPCRKVHTSDTQEETHRTDGHRLPMTSSASAVGSNQRIHLE